MSQSITRKCWCCVSILRLLTRVLCKPIHHFFKLHIASTLNSHHTSSNSVTQDWSDKYHVWGAPQGHLQGQTHNNAYYESIYSSYLPNYPTNYNYFQGLLKYMKGHLLTFFIMQLNVFRDCSRHFSLFLFFLIFFKFAASYAFHLWVKYDKSKLTLLNKIWNDDRYFHITQVYLF